MGDSTRTSVFPSTKLKTIHLACYGLSPSIPRLCFKCLQANRGPHRTEPENRARCLEQVRFGSYPTRSGKVPSPLRH
jgi:hypothetical protein